MSYFTKEDLLTAMEFGYIQCEKGNNIQMAKIEFNKLINDNPLNYRRDE